MIALLSTFILAIAGAAPAFAQGAPTARGFCYSDPSAPVVYFSADFDTKLNPGVANDAYPIQREFHAHLKARYGFTTNSNYPVTCQLSNSTAVSEANRAVFEGRMRQERRQVVEVDWTYLPDAAAAAVSFGPTANTRNPPPPLPADHGFCVGGAFQGPLYESDTFDAVAPVSIGQWGVVWLRFLGGKYGFKGPIQCENATLDGARRILKAWADGARAASRNVVQTGWKYDAAASSAPAPRVDEDREPPRAAPARPAPPADALHFANQEGPAVQKYCLQNHTVSVVFDCIRVRKAVHAYRLAHPTGTPDPLESLFTADRLDCSECFDNSKPGAWARRQALAQRMKPNVAGCVAKEFVAKLKAKPYPNRVQEHYDAAVAACK